jgi:phosphohistidine phosphatase
VRVLYLLRHAKSDWSDESLDDHDRPLAPRGRKAIQRMAAYIDDAGVRPALVLCSTAVRARQTLEGVERALGPDADVWMEDALYGAGAHELQDRLRHLPPAVPSVMVIGHNPGLEDLALGLAGGGEAGAVARMGMKFPTAALATLEVPGGWKSLKRGAATVTAFVVPRALPSPPT